MLVRNNSLFEAKISKHPLQRWAMVASTVAARAGDLYAMVMGHRAGTHDKHRDRADMHTIHLDDLEPGQIHHLGGQTLSRDEIVAFARDWDPQPFHLDEQAAAASIYGGLIASGWHTVCVFMRLFADGMLSRAAAMGSPGVDELRWLKPVRPGDTLEARLEILEVRPSRSKPDRGVVRARSVVVNQDGEEVLSFVATLLFQRRPEAVWAGPGGADR